MKKETHSAADVVHRHRGCQEGRDRAQLIRIAKEIRNS